MNKAFALVTIGIIALGIVGLDTGYDEIIKVEEQKISLDTYSQDILSLTNFYRTDNEMNTLKIDYNLTQAAQNKADDMCSNDYFSHELNDGSEWHTFIDESGYKYQKAGENLARGFEQPSNLFNGWIESPTHKANLDDEWSDIGIGYSECGGDQYVALALAR